MAESRRKRGKDTWRWCRNCSNDPKAEVDTKSTRPGYDLCNECKGKEGAGTCGREPRSRGQAAAIWAQGAENAASFSRHQGAEWLAIVGELCE